MAEEKVNIGGQAVIEGVMMRAPKRFVIAVRTPDNAIVVKKEEIKLDSNKLFKKPVIRGLVMLYDALVLGIRALNFSAFHATGEGEEKPSSFSMFISLVLGLGLGVALFVWLPLVLTELSKKLFPIVDHSFLVFNTVDGIIRVIFFLAYVWVIGFFKDIKRVFMYHGAEHKVISTFEAGEELTVENARKYSRFHPRCGTSFLLIVMVVAIIVFSFIPKDSHFLIKFGSRIVFLPIIAGISYEILKFSGKHRDHWLFKYMTIPGMWIQRLTTADPDDSQIEVAMVSLKEALDMEVTNENIIYVDRSEEVDTTCSAS